MSTPVRLLCSAAVLAGALWSTDARGQVFSPGPLAKPHAPLEGITSCTKCHIQAGQHDNTRCLECHKEIGRRQQRGVGYHARVKADSCASCHRDHRGLNASLINWEGKKADFNHALTGWPLQGEHKKPECKDCHETKRVIDDDARQLIKKGRDSMLGLATVCSSCHFDEHRDQEGDRCAKCHTVETWKKQPLFSHTKHTDFALTGRHKKVACAECHPTQTDNETPADAFPPMNDRSYLQFVDLPHGNCTACHEDVHKGQLGKSCTQCHTTEGWGIIKQNADDRGFHDKTAFPLKGMHTSVGCNSCHGPFPGERARFKGLKHERCADCHFDAHVGQLKPPGKADGAGEAPRCDRCHEVTGFLPTLFNTLLHVDTRYPLEGAHKAVSCALCHKPDKAIERRLPAAVKKETEKKKRQLLVSRAQLTFADFTDRCERCHADPHGGQFEARMKDSSATGGCKGCHQPAAFEQLLFNHDDSRLPLTGNHKKVGCASCHAPSPVARGRVRPTVYRPIEPVCAGCHDDVHLGQLARDNATACDRCHSTEGFTAPVFNHNDPADSRFALEAKHAEAKCEACHPRVDVDGTATARYRPLPVACAGCHADEHGGRYDAFTPPAADAASAVVNASAKASGRCEACHAPSGWTPARFAHERTGFALQGRHAAVACARCHGADTAVAQPASCASCHQDPHAGEFGTSCQGCHDEQAFRAPAFAVDAHRRTGFPLVGRHAALPCDECHVGQRERTFFRVAADCASCHANDARRAGASTIAHRRAPFTTSCQSCHQPVAFSPAVYPQHEACFPLARGSHVGVSCRACHGAAGLRGLTPSGGCREVPVRCAECHTHRAGIEDRRHREVPGYTHVSARCAGCHRGQ